MYINFSRPDDFEFSYDELVRTIHNSPLFEKPPIGNNPFKPVAKEKLDGDKKLLDQVLASILRNQGTDSSAFSNAVVNDLAISPMLFKLAVNKLNRD